MSYRFVIQNPELRSYAYTYILLYQFSLSPSLSDTNTHSHTQRTLTRMSNLLGMEMSISAAAGAAAKPSILNSSIHHFTAEFLTASLQNRSHCHRLRNPATKTASARFRTSFGFSFINPTWFSSKQYLNSAFFAEVVATQHIEEHAEVEIADGYTITQFLDKMIDVFLNEKPKPKDWRNYLVFREEWKKYRDGFYNRCRTRADAETDAQLKQNLIGLARKVKRIDDEMEKHAELLQEIEGSPMDINAIVAMRRRDFSGEFFRHLNLIQGTYDSLEDRDAIARLGAKCLSAVSAYDNTLETVTFDAAKAKFDDILNSPSVDAACEKIRSLAKAKELDSSLVLLINSVWASAKDSSTMKNEVKDIMYHIYRTTRSSLKSIAPKEIKLLKYLLNITDPEERFSALATAFSPGDDHEARDPNAIYTTPKDLHKWIKIMLDAYQQNKEETDIREAKQLTRPVIIQRLFLLKETIEEEYLAKEPKGEKDRNAAEEL